MEDKITREYLLEEVRKALRISFSSHSLKSVHIYSFLKDKHLKELKSSLKKSRTNRVFQADSHSFGKVPENKKVSSIFCSQEFKKLINEITGKKIKKISIQIKSFAHKDFTIMHDSVKRKDELEFIYFISEDFPFNAGGNRVYVTESGKGNSFVFPPVNNSLIIVEQNSSTNSFFQYINHLAKKNKYFAIHGIIK